MEDLKLIKTVFFRHARYQIFLVNGSGAFNHQYIVFKHLEYWRGFDTLEDAEKEIRQSSR